MPRAFKSGGSRRGTAAAAIVALIAIVVAVLWATGVI